MRFFGKKEQQEIRADTQADTQTADDVLLSALVGSTAIGKSEALEIPTVNACVEYIANTVSMLPIKLYREVDGKVEEVKDDIRLRLLNRDTGDTLTATQFKKALVRDYLLDNGGYAYLNKKGNQLESIHYVERSQVSTIKNTDPIFKDYDISIFGKKYAPFDFLKILRKTKDGCESKSIIDENNMLLSVGYNTIKFEDNLVRLGGNKKGFVKSVRKLSEEALTALKAAWKKLYSNNNENVVILNDGMEFQESSNTSVEMQLNENKETNAVECCKLFNVPIAIIKGTATSQDYINGFKLACMPVIADVTCSLNRDMLLEFEKDTMYFGFDVKELTKGDIKERYDAYKTAIEMGFKNIDEVRYMENDKPFGIDWINLSLNSSLYNLKTGEIYTPNTNQTNKMKGSDTVADGITK